MMLFGKLPVRFLTVSSNPNVNELQWVHVLLYS